MVRNQGVRKGPFTPYLCAWQFLMAHATVEQFGAASVAASVPEPQMQFAPKEVPEVVLRSLEAAVDV